jgi:hypothetical protein
MRTISYWAVFAVSLGGLIVSPSAWAGGHCNYTQQSAHGAYDVCEMPVTAEDCAALDEREWVNDTDAVGGACPTADVVGTCDKGSTQIVYYSGEADQLKIGCGFQGGTWLNGYANP